MEVISCILFAQRSRSDGFREGFRGTNNDVLLSLLIVATLVAGMWAISRLVSIGRKRHEYNSPWRLFWALCKAHHLNWSDRWLLRRVARARALHDPGRLFLEAQHWEEKNLGPRFAPEYPHLKALRTQIFGEMTRSRVIEPNSRPAPPVAKLAPSTSRPAPSLFPGQPSPSLDVPPWTAERR